MGMGSWQRHQQQQQSQQLPVQLQLQGKRKGANVCLTSSSTGYRQFQQVIQQTMPARAFQTLLCSEKKTINPHFFSLIWSKYFFRLISSKEIRNKYHLPGAWGLACC